MPYAYTYQNWPEWLDFGNLSPNKREIRKHHPLPLSRKVSTYDIWDQLSQASLPGYEFPKWVFQNGCSASILPASVWRVSSNFWYFQRYYQIAFQLLLKKLDMVINHPNLLFFNLEGETLFRRKTTFLRMSRPP